MVFNYLRDIDLIKVSAVSTQWNSIVKLKQKFSSKFKGSQKLNFVKDWLLKSYKATFNRLRNDTYWEIIKYLSVENLGVLEYELYNRMYYSILPFRVWSYLWTCCRSQFDPNICQFCTKLLMKDKRINKDS